VIACFINSIAEGGLCRLCLFTAMDFTLLHQLPGMACFLFIQDLVVLKDGDRGARAPHPTPGYIYKMNPTKLVVRVDMAISRKDHDPQIMKGQGNYTIQLSPRLPVRIICKIISVGPASASEGVHGFENVH
jgi:hypothetical protein